MNKIENILYNVTYILLILCMLCLLVVWFIGIFDGATLTHQLLRMAVFFILDIDICAEHMDKHFD